MEISVEKLQINYKTLEEFTKFKEYGNEELAMLEDLKANIIENDSDSPFYGIYFGGSLVARMSLYHNSARFDHYFQPPQEFLELRKLEVLPAYQRKGYGNALVQFAKGFRLPIITYPRIQSRSFWERMEFKPAPVGNTGEPNENALIFIPKETNK